MTIMKQRVNEMNDVQYNEDCLCNVQWTYGQKKECVLQRYNVYIFDNLFKLFRIYINAGTLHI